MPSLVSPCLALHTNTPFPSLRSTFTCGPHAPHLPPPPLGHVLWHPPWPSPGSHTTLHMIIHTAPACGLVRAHRSAAGVPAGHLSMRAAPPRTPPTRPPRAPPHSPHRRARQTHRPSWSPAPLYVACTAQQRHTTRQVSIHPTNTCSRLPLDLPAHNTNGECAMLHYKQRCIRPLSTHTTAFNVWCIHHFESTALRVCSTIKIFIDRQPSFPYAL